MNQKLKKYTRYAGLAVKHPILASKRAMYNSRRFAADRAYPFGYCNYPTRIFFIAGMAMSASTWMKNLLARVPGIYTRPHTIPDEVWFRGNICDAAFMKVPLKGNSLFKTHLKPTKENVECLKRNGVEKILITHRDLRDVVIARYNRLVEFPKFGEFGDSVEYSKMGREKAMDHCIDVVAEHFVCWIRGWVDIANRDPERYHFSRFEDLRRDTKVEFQKVLTFYQIELPDEKIDNIIEAAKGKHSMKKNIKAAKILPWGYSSNFRSGKIGSWRQELSAAEIEKCKKVFGDVLIELGYEKNHDWSVEH